MPKNERGKCREREIIPESEEQVLMREILKEILKEKNYFVQRVGETEVKHLTKIKLRKVQRTGEPEEQMG